MDALTHPHICYSMVEQFDIDMMGKLMISPSVSKQDKLQLRAYRKKAFDGNKVRVEYDLGHATKDKGYGRLHAKFYSFQNMRGDLRAALAMRNYWDVDMAKCHPTILAGVCDREGWAAPALQEFVRNPAATLADISQYHGMTPGDAKAALNAILFEGAAPAPVEGYDFLQRLRAETVCLNRNMAAAYPESMKLARKAKGAVTNAAYVIRTYENSILMSMVKHFEAQGRTVGTLIFDGFLVQKRAGETELPADLLRGAEAAILKDTGFRMQLVVKPLVTTLDLSGVLTEEQVDDDAAAAKFVEVYGHNKLVRCNDEVLVYDNASGMWRSDKRALTDAVASVKHQLTFQYTGCDGKERTLKYGCDVHLRRRLVEMVQDHIHVDNDFWNSNLDTSQYKMLCKDGIYDAVTDTFTRGFDPAIVFAAGLDFPYPPEDAEAEAELEDALFIRPFTDANKEVGQYYKRVIAGALHGDYGAKHIVFGVGLANCGKGITTRGLQATYRGYIGTFNAASLSHNKGSGSDVAKQNSWLVPNMRCRIMISNELETGVTLSGNIIKMVSGGGDTVVARQNNRDEAEFIVRPTALLLLNDIPKISPVDSGVAVRVKIVQIDRNFAADGVEGTDTLPMDPTLKTRVQQPRFKNAMFHIMRKAFLDVQANGYQEPPQIAAAYEEYVGVESGPLARLEKRFVITRLDDDYVTCAKLKEFCDREQLGISTAALGRLLGKATGFAGDQRESINGVQTRVRRGIKELAKPRGEWEGEE